MNTLTETILQRLRDRDGYVSGEDLSRELHVSRAAISKHVQTLRQMGYRIESVPRRGHRLLAGINQARTAEVQPLLTTAAFGRNLLYHELLPSTNRLAMHLASEGAPQGTVVVAEQQTEGRGRLARAWHSPGGANLYASIILRPAVAPARVPELALVTAISLRDSLLSQWPELPLGIKWPNDLWADGRKVSGILCEMSAEMDCVRHVVVGVGINVNLTAADLPDALRERATSLRMLTGESLSRPGILASFLNTLETDFQIWEDARDLEPFLDTWRPFCVLSGRRVVVEQVGNTKIQGIARGIDRNGRLLVETAAGMIPVNSGDAHIAQVGTR